MELSELAKEQLLNWDHDINPTPLKDIEFNIAHYIATKHGWGLDNVAVQLNHKVLDIRIQKFATFGKGQSFGQACDGFWSMEVYVDFDDIIPREHLGRVGNWLPVGVYVLADHVKTIH